MKILLIGDTLLDHYVYGSVSRVSPEGPWLILDKEDEKYTLGGAANVGANILSLCKEEEIEIDYYGLSSREIAPLFPKQIRLKLQFIKNNEILTKTRFVSNSHHLLRVDNAKYYSDEALKQVRNIMLPLKDYDLIVVSDYKKRSVTVNIWDQILCTPTPKLIEAKRLIDDSFLFPESVIFKCNEKEFQEIDLNLDKFNEIIVTMGSKGYRLEKSKKFFPATEKKTEVIDVVGCGDVFLAGMAANFIETQNFDAESMAAFANLASGEKVRHFGTVAVKREWIK